MPFIIKLLGNGTTNNGSNTGLYTASATCQGAIVSNVKFVNTASVSGTVNLYIKRGGTQYRILDKDKIVNAGDILVVKPELTLAANDAIEVTTTQVMDFAVSGMEKV